jgi:hypothetical protein
MTAPVHSAGAVSLCPGGGGADTREDLDSSPLQPIITANNDKTAGIKEKLMVTFLSPVTINLRANPYDTTR